MRSAHRNRGWTRAVRKRAAPSCAKPEERPENWARAREPAGGNGERAPKGGKRQAAPQGGKRQGEQPVLMYDAAPAGATRKAHFGVGGQKGGYSPVRAQSLCAAPEQKAWARVPNLSAATE